MSHATTVTRTKNNTLSKLKDKWKRFRQGPVFWYIVSMVFYICTLFVQYIQNIDDSDTMSLTWEKGFSLAILIINIYLLDRSLRRPEIIPFLPQWMIAMNFTLGFMSLLFIIF